MILKWDGPEIEGPGIERSQSWIRVVIRFKNGGREDFDYPVWLWMDRPLWTRSFLFTEFWLAEPKGTYLKTNLSKILHQIENSNVEQMDRWHIDSSDPTIDLPLNVMNNYFSIGVDAAACLKFHSERGGLLFITRVPQNYTEDLKEMIYK